MLNVTMRSGSPPSTALPGWDAAPGQQVMLGQAFAGKRVSKHGKTHFFSSSSASSLPYPVMYVQLLSVPAEIPREEAAL